MHTGITSSFDSLHQQALRPQAKANRSVVAAVPLYFPDNPFSLTPRPSRRIKTDPQTDDPLARSLVSEGYCLSPEAAVSKVRQANLIMGWGLA